MDRIYLDGRHYDLMFPRSDDVEFFLNQARMLGGPVLELASGTGRILERIANAGFAATGIDLSPGMLAEARRKAQAGATPSRYIQADMRRYSLGERFALIFIAGNSICHLLDIESFDACISCVRQHLAEGGRFIVDVYVPNLRLLLVDPQEISETEGSLELKMYFPQELQALLRHNGLRLLEAYGSYEKTPLTNASAKQIYILEAA